jgi:hypothetical protein
MAGVIIKELRNIYEKNVKEPNQQKSDQIVQESGDERGQASNSKQTESVSKYNTEESVRGYRHM